ncbi:MAG: YceI family protein [Pseudomonadota bacterium]
MKKLLAAGLIATFAFAGSAIAADKYVLDASHSQVIFEYDHLGFSTTYGMFSGFTGDILFDTENPKASSVNVIIDTETLFTGWDGRTKHFLGGDFFDASKAPKITFSSTGINVTGENTAIITGDLTMNGITKSVELDTKMNKKGMHPRAKKEWVGFDASTTIVRSEFDMGLAAPFVSDEVVLEISIEAEKQ